MNLSHIIQVVNHNHLYPFFYTLKNQESIV